ncbi:hypothetical protein ACFFVH_28280, partial [Streptomyces echinatus]|uniref:hypothetical protein n=1 Tax=Streptomyces echinatus TaxID=67293 RepID=UPI0035E664A8
ERPCKGALARGAASQGPGDRPKDNYVGRNVCVGREGGTIGDLRSYQLNDTTHSLRNNDTPCGA